MAEALLLQVRDLCVEIPTHGGFVSAVRGVSYAVAVGSTLALVGESGCGKSVSVQSMMGLMGVAGLRVTGSARFAGEELLGMPEASLNRVRGRRVGMIYQDPLSAFNPMRTIGDQIAETLLIHRGMSRRAALTRARELLDECRLSQPARRLAQYPFELSGGMLQRAMIAMALACEPELLIADEPTTALDVTTQDQILWLLRDLQQRRGMAIVLITHDLAVVARMADQVAVMYAGQLVEEAEVRSVFDRPAHPYTQALLKATPRADSSGCEQLATIDGSPPDLFAPPPGCGFTERCAQAMQLCQHYPPELLPVAGAGSARCWLHHRDCPQRGWPHD